MADWKTYAKAARNTARKQAPGARDAAQRTTARASGYARAAGRALDEGLRDRDHDAAQRPDDGPRDDVRRDAPRHDARRDDTRREASSPPTATREEAPGARGAASPDAAAPRNSSRSFRDDAKIYAAVAGRTAQRAGKQAREAGIGGRIGRAVRDALLIGVSLLVIWGVLYAAGLPIPFGAVIIAVVIIVLIALAGGLYAQFARDRKGATAQSESESEAEAEQHPSEN